MGENLKKECNLENMYKVCLKFNGFFEIQCSSMLHKSIVTILKKALISAKTVLFLHVLDCRHSTKISITLVGKRNISEETSC